MLDHLNPQAQELTIDGEWALPAAIESRLLDHSPMNRSIRGFPDPGCRGTSRHFLEPFVD